MFWYSIIILLYSCQIVNNFLYFFLWYISFFRYFFIMFICNCFWVIFVVKFWRLYTLLLVKSPAAVFWITLLEVVLSASIVDFLEWSRGFLAVFTTHVFTYIFTNISTHSFSKRQNPWLLTNIRSPGWTEQCIIFYIWHFKLTKMMFIWSSISSSLEFWLINHTLIYENSELNVLTKRFIRNKCIQDSWILLIIIVSNITMD